jgi:hypothetical protein
MNCDPLDGNELSPSDGRVALFASNTEILLFVLFGLTPFYYLFSYYKWKLLIRFELARNKRVTTLFVDDVRDY